MILPLIIPSFIAGVLTFLAPCTLPLVPGYLAFISGVSLEDLKDPTKSKKARLKIFLNGVFFILGFSLVFVILGTLVGFLGQTLVPYRIWLSRIGGVFVILFGLFMLNILRVPFLAQEKQLKVPNLFKRGSPLSSLILGSAFGVGWTPCVGPILGAILVLATTTATALEGALLLSIFSLGLVVPFLLIGWGIGSASRYIEKISKYLNAISFVGGIFLIFLGILLLTGKLAAWISFFFQAFSFINYDRLLEYL